MTERPILFSAPMVRAILAGAKTQTRRAIKPPPVYGMVPGRPDLGGGWIFTPRGRTERYNNPAGSNGFAECLAGSRLCPYGVHGDRLWVRETFKDFKNSGETLYRADFPSLETTSNWTPSIHMPRWASRITLDVTEVRVQRLQAISEEDAKAEGVESVRPIAGDPMTTFRDYAGGEDPCEWFSSARDSFASLWRDINGPESWDLNPWVWAISFRRLP